jgi:hypothetical protein
VDRDSSSELVKVAKRYSDVTVRTRSMTSDRIWSEPMCLLQRSSYSAEKLDKLCFAAAENNRLQQGNWSVPFV